MAKFVLDLTNADTANAAPLGRWAGTIVSAEHGFSKSSGNPTLTVHVDIETDQGRFDGMRVFSLTEKALWAVKAFLLAIGYEPSELNGAIEIDPDDMVDRPCGVIVTNKTYQGQVRRNIDIVALSQIEHQLGAVDADLPF